MFGCWLICQRRSRPTSCTTRSGFYGPVCVRWWDEGFTGVVSQWWSPHNYRLLCCYVKWNRYWRGKRKWSGYPWKAFLFSQFQISVSSIMCVRNPPLSALESSDHSLRRILARCFTHYNNIFNITSFTRTLPLGWRQKKRHQSVTFLLPESDCLCWLLIFVIVSVFTKSFHFSVQMVDVSSHVCIYTSFPLHALLSIWKYNIFVQQFLAHFI